MLKKFNSVISTLIINISNTYKTNLKVDILTSNLTKSTNKLIYNNKNNKLSLEIISLEYKINLLPTELQNIIIIYKIKEWIKTGFLHGVNCFRISCHFYYQEINKKYFSYEVFEYRYINYNYTKKIKYNILLNTETYKMIEIFNDKYNISSITSEIYIDCKSFLYDLHFNSIRTRPIIPIKIYIYLETLLKHIDIWSKGGIMKNIILNNRFKVLYLNFPNGHQNIELYFHTEKNITKILKSYKIESSIDGLFVKYGSNVFNSLFYITNETKENHFINLNVKDNRIILDSYINFRRLYKEYINLINIKNTLTYCNNWINTKHKWNIKLIYDFFNNCSTYVICGYDDDEYFIPLKYKEKNINIKVNKVYGTYFFKFLTETKKDGIISLFKISSVYQVNRMTQNEKLKKFQYINFSCYKISLLEKHFEIIEHIQEEMNNLIINLYKK